MSKLGDDHTAVETDRFGSPDQPIFSDMSQADRSHPLFRRGYNLGYSDRAHEEALDELEKHGPRSARRNHVPTASFGVTAGDLLDRLEPGVRVLRELKKMTAAKITTETPCCGRRITLTMPDETETRPTMCCRCRITYSAGLIQEEPDGYTDDDPTYVAVFTVERTGVAAAAHRAGTWELTRRKSAAIRGDLSGP